MLKKLENDLKDAILDLPNKEKDKLLIRLVRKDKTLINQLHFQLLEDECDLESRRATTLISIDTAIRHIEQVKDNRYFNARKLLLDLRMISGYVNSHFLITKDKPGEVELRLHILLEIFKTVPNFFVHDDYGNEKLLKYITGRIKSVYTTYAKLHEDLQYDYKEKVNTILKFAYSSALKYYVKEIPIPSEV